MKLSQAIIKLTREVSQRISLCKTLKEYDEFKPKVSTKKWLAPNKICKYKTFKNKC